MMSPPLPFSASYQLALGKFIAHGSKAGAVEAAEIAAQAVASGMTAMELAKFHERIMNLKLLPAAGAGRLRLARQRGAQFFAAVASGAVGFVEALSRRNVELGGRNRKQARELVGSRAAAAALGKREREFAKALKESELLKEQLRSLSRQILSAQEDERKTISRELHDVIAQTLIGINLRLATLKKEAETNTATLGRNIALTQRLVTRSANIVHEFARELRPPALDDLGLIAALHGFMKNFTTRTGVRSHLTAFAAIEDLDLARRTVLFRVAQEAITNVGRHACADNLKIDINKHARTVRMTIHDDGKSFAAEALLLSPRGKRLGLLGMRERVEMIGGSFKIQSAPGSGTTVTVDIPAGGKTRRAATASAGLS